MVFGHEGRFMAIAQILTTIVTSKITSAVVQPKRFLHLATTEESTRHTFKEGTLFFCHLLYELSPSQPSSSFC